MKADLDDGRINYSGKCDICGKIEWIYDMGGYFSCKGCIILSENDKLNQKNNLLKY